MESLPTACSAARCAQVTGVMLLVVLPSIGGLYDAWRHRLKCKKRAVLAAVEAARKATGDDDVEQQEGRMHPEQKKSGT